MAGRVEVDGTFTLTIAMVKLVSGASIRVQEEITVHRERDENGKFASTKDVRDALAKRVRLQLDEAFRVYEAENETL